MPELLLVTPPFTQLNTPYPATAYLKGFCNTRGISCAQLDLGILVILEIFTAEGLRDIFARPPVQGEERLSSNGLRIRALREDYVATIDGTIAFLQGRNPTLARAIASENYLPQAGRFTELADLDFAFGAMGHQDRAKHLATLYLEDLADYIVEAIDPHFGFSRYAERLGRSANSFDELAEALAAPLSYVDEVTLRVFQRELDRIVGERKNDHKEGSAPAPSPSGGWGARAGADHSPSGGWGARAGADPSPSGGWGARAGADHSPSTGRGARAGADHSLPRLIGFSVPFPGNLFAGFRCAQYLKEHYPAIATSIGGGFPNTELRSVTDPRVFDYFDYITLDDGELPLELLLSNLRVPGPANPDHQLLKRTFLRQDGTVTYNDFSLRRDYPMSQVGTPDYTGLPLDRYVSVIEIANPMHSLWSDGRWNKLTMAHGCYWGKCTFCDVSLDYIGNYQPVAASLLVDRIEELIMQTGENGFHFVDEAAPPALMRDVALEILRRNLRLTWWTNIRFEKSFTPDLCRLLQASGCIAVSGGLEVASDRLLDLIQKGVTVEQVARVTQAFTDAGIMVHAYLMYGYPTQTEQETIDSLEMVRQLFQAGVLQSGFWHQFALTAHSPVGLDPSAFGVTPHLADISFANNDVQFTDATGIDHARFSYGLKKSLFNYMHGYCFDYPLQEWFDFPVPATTIPPDYIAECLDFFPDTLGRPRARVVWTGALPLQRELPDGSVEITLVDRRDTDQFVLGKGRAAYLLELLARTSVRAVAVEGIAADQGCATAETQAKESLMTVATMVEDFPPGLGAFGDFWEGKEMELVRGYGLLVV